MAKRRVEKNKRKETKHEEKGKKKKLIIETVMALYTIFF